MPLSLRQKRIALRLGEPGFRLAHWLARLVSLDLFRSHDITPPKSAFSVLVMRLDTIGDVLLTEPAIAHLRTRFPAARLHVVCGSAGEALLAGHPAIDRLIVFDAPWHAAWRGESVRWAERSRELLRVLRELRRQRYAFAFEMRGDIRDILFARLCGARTLVGNGWRGGGYLLHHDVPAPADEHRVAFALRIASWPHPPPEARSPRLQLTGDQRTAAARALAPLDGRPCVAFHLGAGFPSKCLPAATFAAVANRLRERGLSTVVVGGPGEDALAREFEDVVAERPLVLVGKLGILETAAVLERCDLFIGNDSGPMHLAAAVGTPVVCFFGPSEPKKYHPHGAPYRLLELDLPCRPCDHVHCVQGENICLTGIRADDIVAAAEELLAPVPVSRRARLKGGGFKEEE